VAEPGYEYGPEPIEVLPVVVVSQTFPARPSSIPEIRDFVRRCLNDSPLSEEGTREVGETVFRALLDAAGATGSIQVAFRIFPEHVEVDVLHSDTQPGPAGQAGPGPGTEATAPGTAAAAGDGRAPAAAAGRGPAPSGVPAEHSSSFAEWMANALRRERLTQEQAARQLGVSVKTVSRWLGGETHPRMRDLRRIRDRFGEIPLH
jgi:hypothetical protein